MGELSPLLDTNCCKRAEPAVSLPGVRDITGRAYTIGEAVPMAMLRANFDTSRVTMAGIAAKAMHT